MEKKITHKLSMIVLVLIATVLMSSVSNVYAYRPFDSTDAAVLEKGETEIELGLYNFTDDGGLDEISIPSFIFNYGLTDTWEIIAEFELQTYKEGDDDNCELKDPAIFLKHVFKEGFLQDKDGACMAVEFGVLLPSTVNGEHTTGLEAIGIYSGQLSDFVYHINLGAELDRSDFALNAVWGTILEYPINDKFRIVGEINGTFKRNDIPSNSGLIGFIWEVGDINFDLGVRRGFSSNASDWGLTTGISFAF
jgi:hypothetical protein